jgi:1-acyl-sn-glycerol-3-phosphate acyltransferase
MRPIYLLIFKILGWKINGDFSPEFKKYIVAVAPHTSNWDFVVGIAARSIVGMKKIKFLAKSPLFKPPHGWIFRALGGYPVERSSSHDMVSRVAALFDAHERFVLAIAPEGTRKKVDKLRTGFYYIAKAAGVPIIPVGFDFKKKAVIIGDPLHPTDDIAADFQKLYSFYSQISGKNPVNGISQQSETPSKRF